MAGVIAVQVLAVVFGLVSIGLIVWAGTRLGRRLMDATPPLTATRWPTACSATAPATTRPNKSCWPSVAASPGTPGPCPGGLRRLEWPPAPPWGWAGQSLGGARRPFPQAVSPRHRPGGRLRSDRGRGCRHRVLGDHRGAACATRVALVALAAVLVALAVAAVVAPPVESGSQVVGVGGVCGCVWPAAWPCSAPPSWPSAARRPLRLQRSESWSPAVIIQTA